MIIPKGKPVGQLLSKEQKNAVPDANLRVLDKKNASWYINDRLPMSTDKQEVIWLRYQVVIKQRSDGNNLYCVGEYGMTGLLIQHKSGFVKNKKLIEDLVKQFNETYRMALEKNGVVRGHMR